MTAAEQRALRSRVRLLEDALCKVISFAASAGDTLGLREALDVIVTIARTALQAPKGGR